MRLPWLDGLDAGADKAAAQLKAMAAAAQGVEVPGAAADSVERVGTEATGAAKALGGHQAGFFRAEAEQFAQTRKVATIDTMVTPLKDTAMKVMTARDAKNHFGEFLDSARREPVVVTKNGRPVGIMISLEDAKDTLFADFFIDKESGYEEWLFGKVTKTMDRLASGATSLHEHGDAMALMKGRLEARLRKSA